MVSAKAAQRLAVGLGLAFGLLFCLSLEAFGAAPKPTHCCPNCMLCSTAFIP
ncbi:MAG: hypothetical protein AAF495_12025 [Pseudomonadota bacterium]